MEGSEKGPSLVCFLDLSPTLHLRRDKVVLSVLQSISLDDVESPIPLSRTTSTPRGPREKIWRHQPVYSLSMSGSWGRVEGEDGVLGRSYTDSLGLLTPRQGVIVVGTKIFVFCIE